MNNLSYQKLDIKLLSLPYVYKITENATGKFYFGHQKKRGCNPAHLGTKYFTSSTVFAKEFRKNPSNFTVEIVGVFWNSHEDPDAPERLEQTLIKANFSNGLCVNHHASVGIHNTQTQKMWARVNGNLTKGMKVGINSQSKAKREKFRKKATKASKELFTGAKYIHNGNVVRIVTEDFLSDMNMSMDDVMSLKEFKKFKYGRPKKDEFIVG